MNRVTNIVWRTASGARLGGFAYEYDAVRRIVSRRHALGTNAFNRAYAYDDLDRLSSDGGVSYIYDAAGNRTTKTENGEVVTYSLGVGDRLASWTGGAYSYDAAGCVTRIERDGRPKLDLTWNGQYQLVSVLTNGVFAEGYAYDALGRRVSTTTQEGTVRHVYDNNWQVVADVGTNGNIIASYVWGEGIDNLLAVKVGDASYYPLTDIQGTVWGYIDSQNNIVARWQYDAWGNVVDEEIASTATALASLRFRFQGREWSAATGLINFRMRWYDAEPGRWLSKDPIGLNGGLNLYAFCGNNPINCTDPSGEDLMNFMFAASDFLAGFGDTISFGATRAFREAVYPEFGLSDMTDMCSGAYTAGECTSVAYDVAWGAAGGWAAAGTKVKGVTEFSHWIPKRYLKKTGSQFIEKTFGLSKWNGNYVTKARHAMHDPYRYYMGTKKLPTLLRQLDRVPRVYYGILAGGGIGVASDWFSPDTEK